MSKDDSKPSGLRGFFSRRKSKSSTLNKEAKPEQAKSEDASTESLPPVPGDAARSDSISSSTSRRKYVPRYAARDMVLSMPVEQRPDLVAKAREAQRQDVCSEIGFNTTLRPSNSSIRSATSQGRYSLPLSTHPNLQISQQTTSMLHPNSSRASLRSMRSTLPRSVSTPTPLQKMVSASDIDGNEASAPHRRPPARPFITETAVPGRLQTEQLLEKMLRGDDDASVTSDFTRPSTHVDGHSVTAPASRPPRQYFSHNNALPNLRTNGGGGVAGSGKGKERAYGLARSVTTDSNFEASPQTSFESRDAYVIKTQARQMPMKTAIGLAPPISSITASRESSVSDSTDSRFLTDVSLPNGTSTRAESLNTVITEQTENEQEPDESGAIETGKGKEKAKDEDEEDPLKKAEQEPPPRLDIVDFGDLGKTIG